MTPGVLVDAGPLVAIFNRRDRDHERCIDVLKKFRLPLHTTWIPVTEAMHLLDFSVAAQNALLEMIERGVLKIVGLRTNDLVPIRALINKYQDQAMDFADATLVHVANREGFLDIFTLDQRDFGVYRLERGRALRMVPT